MSYSIVLGDLGPPMPLTLTEDDLPVALNGTTDTITLRYECPDGVTRTRLLTITSAPGGQVQAEWQAGDLPAIGYYYGQVNLARTGDATYPRTYPDDGSRVIWYAHRKI